MSRRKVGSGRSTPASVGSGRGTTKDNNVLPPETLWFVRRSLQRNDVELAAVDQLNASLASLKTQLLEQPGGAKIMLQLGNGELCLAAPDITCPPKQMPAPEANPAWPTLQDNAAAQALPNDSDRDKIKQQCVDFLERRLLRRRLLNRLFRRLLRVATVLDAAEGKRSATLDDPSKPPPTPRYGEDRLNITHEAAQQWQTMVQRQQQALQCKLRRAEEQQDPPEKIRQGPLADEDEAFLEYKVTYTRLKKDDNNNNNNNTVHYLADAEAQPHWMGPKVAAAQRNMSNKEKEAEYQRWKAALYGRIPLQPTFDEIQPAVFNLEKRLEAAQKVDQQDVMDVDEKDVPKAESADEELSEKKQNEKVDTTSDDMEVDQTFSDDDKDKKDEKAAEKDARDGDKASQETQDDDDDEKKEEKALKRTVRPISLIPVPSFYDQDTKRMKMMQAEVMSVSMQNFARRRTTEVVNDYNKALRRSNELNERRARLQNNVTAVMQENARFVHQVEKTYKEALGAAHQQWNKRRMEFEKTRLNTYMPNRNNPNHRPDGTALTKVYATQKDPIHHTVATCMGDILDVAIAAGEGKFRIERFQEEFQPPVKPDVHSNPNYVSSLRAEESLRKDFAAVTAELRVAEEERQKAWKRMMKTKAEFEMPGRGASSNYNMPQLRQTVLTPAPRMHTSMPPDPQALARMAMASMPNSAVMAAATGPPSSDSKYSAARVRERIGADGTVVPVTAPKRGPDGLFIRPAGRTRKNMDWDSVRGIWVPKTPDPMGAGENPPSEG